MNKMRPRLHRPRVSIYRLRPRRPIFISSYIKRTKTGTSTRITSHWRGGSKREKIAPKPVSNVKVLADKLVRTIAYRGLASRISIAGSIGRGRPNPKDIDLVVIPKDKDKFIQEISNIGLVTSKGEHSVNVSIDHIPTNIYFATPQDFSAQVFHRMGPKGSAIANRKLAESRGYLLNQYGLFDKKTGKLIASTAHEIYHKLGKTWRPPAKRGLPR